jgi:hypothetical protein
MWYVLKARQGEHMKNKLPIIGGLVAVVAVTGWVLFTSEGELAGHATGAQSAKEAVWEQLGTYKNSYLKEWKDVLEDENPSAVDVVEAFNEVGFAVTGKGGLWRNKIPNQWLGCSNSPESQPCQAIAKHEDEFLEWDSFQESLTDISERKAKRFLVKNKKRMLSYLDTYVPDGKTNKEVESTPFFAEEIKPALASGE